MPQNPLPTRSLPTKVKILVFVASVPESNLLEGPTGPGTFPATLETSGMRLTIPVHGSCLTDDQASIDALKKKFADGIQRLADKFNADVKARQG